MVIHASGKNGFTDTIDHCIGHDDEDNMRPITTEQAQAMRYRHRCGAIPLRLVKREVVAVRVEIREVQS